MKPETILELYNSFINGNKSYVRAKMKRVSGLIIIGVLVEYGYDHKYAYGIAVDMKT